MDMYLILVLILAVLAAIDLTVGVSNDAVNFLNSAQGSKVASMRTILVVASLGVLLGTLSSSGMMEVARKGVFDPAFFTFTDIMWVFLAVMFTDVLLLDYFNGKGLPTSTTVSLVFGLLGAGTVVAIQVAQKFRKMGTMT
jgi:phosphate/sulfate permease